MKTSPEIVRTLKTQDRLEQDELIRVMLLRGYRTVNKELEIKLSSPTETSRNYLQQLSTLKKSEQKTLERQLKALLNNQIRSEKEHKTAKKKLKAAKWQLEDASNNLPRRIHMAAYILMEELGVKAFSKSMISNLLTSKGIEFSNFNTSIKQMLTPKIGEPLIQTASSEDDEDSKEQFTLTKWGKYELEQLLNP